MSLCTTLNEWICALELSADLGGLEVSLLRLLEVDDVPDSGEVVGLDVLVLEVEGVLPDINTDDRGMGCIG